MKKLRPYYERELGSLEGYNAAFAEKFPVLASELGMSGGACADPEILLLMQAAAVLNARTAKRLDDNYPEFTEALLQVNAPHYLRPFPSTSIARFDASGDNGAKMNAVTVIPRGTPMNSVEHQGVICKFKTVYDVTIAPLVLAQVRFNPIIDVPPALPRPAAVASSISITMESTSATRSLAELGLQSLRIFIDGEQSLCATLRDLLFMHTPCAYVEVEGKDGWRALEQVPLRAAGFAAEDALIPFQASSHPAYRLLTEYFAFPEKFNFLDLDLAALTRDLPDDCRRLTLHLGIADVHVNSDTARILRSLSSKNLLLACTPVINLFKQGASPIELTHTSTEYELLANPKLAHAHDIYSVDAVHIVRDSPQGRSITEFHPYYSTRHGTAGGKRGRYWMLRRDAMLAVTSPGHEMQISFVDIDLDPSATETATVSIELTCSNRDFPRLLAHGSRDGDLQRENATDLYPIRLLRRPSPPYRFAAEAHWRLISQLSLNHRSLARDGLETFIEMLTLYDLPQSAVSQRQIRSVVGLSHQTTRAWIADQYGGGHVHGIEVQLTLDEEAFAGASMHAFAQVIDHFLGLYVHLNSFTQLIVLSKMNGKELLRCPPRNGDIALL